MPQLTCRTDRQRWHQQGEISYNDYVYSKSQQLGR